MAASGCVLIADDEAAFMLATAELLRKEGYHCECAPDAHQAIGMLQQKRYDVLICDVMMPGNEQLRVVQIAQEFVPGMPVILVTGCPSIETAVGSLQLPVLAYLTKPIDYKELLAQIRTAAGFSHNYLVLSDVCRHLRECFQSLEAARDRRLALTRMHSSTSVVSPIVLRLLASCLSELVQLQSDLSSGEEPSLLCELLDCPQQRTCRHAIEDTIDVLQKTKSTFKSKDLAGLRCRLEELVKNPPHFSHSSQSRATLL